MAPRAQFCCNGTVVDDPELGNVIQLQGDQRKNVLQFLTQEGLVKKELIKVHGEARMATACGRMGLHGGGAGVARWRGGCTGALGDGVGRPQHMRPHAVPERPHGGGMRPPTAHVVLLRASTRLCGVRII